MRGADISFSFSHFLSHIRRENDLSHLKEVSQSLTHSTWEFFDALGEGESACFGLKSQSCLNTRHQAFGPPLPANESCSNSAGKQ